MTKDKLNLDKTVNLLKKKYGSIKVASSMKDDYEMVSTGNLALDLALEGGVAWGYAAEFSGGSGSGKTLLLQMMLANAQKQYKNTIGIWFDREKAYFKKRAVELGIDNEKVILVEPQDIPTVKQAEDLFLDIFPTLPKDAYKFIVIDSISSFAKDTSKADMGKKAQSLHNLFRTILPLIDERTLLLFSNQRTFKVGVLWGNPETTTCGEGPKYYSTYRLKLDDVKPIKDEKRGGEIIGNWIKCTIIKTRLGPSFRETTMPFYYKEGIPYYGGLARLLAEKNILKPNNKKEFKAFKTRLLSYGEEEVNEFKIEKFLKTHPEIDISKYPEYKFDEEKE